MEEVAIGMNTELKEFAKSLVKAEVIADVIDEFESGVECAVDTEDKKVVVVTLEFELLACDAEGSAIRPSVETEKLVKAIDVDERTQELLLKLLCIVIEIEEGKRTTDPMERGYELLLALLDVNMEVDGSRLLDVDSVRKHANTQTC